MTDDSHPGERMSWDLPPWFVIVLGAAGLGGVTGGGSFLGSTVGGASLVEALSEKLDDHESLAGHSIALERVQRLEQRVQRVEQALVRTDDRLRKQDRNILRICARLDAKCED